MIVPVIKGILMAVTKELVLAYCSRALELLAAQANKAYEGPTQDVVIHTSDSTLTKLVNVLKDYLISYVRRSITTSAANDIADNLKLEMINTWNDVEDALSDIVWLKGGKPVKIESIANPLVHALKMAINATDSAADDILSNTLAKTILNRHVDIMSGKLSKDQFYDKNTLLNEYLIETPSKFATNKTETIRFLTSMYDGDQSYIESIAMQCDHLLHDLIKLADIPEGKFLMPYDASSLINMIYTGTNEKTEGSRINASRYRKAHKFIMFTDTVAGAYQRNVDRQLFYNVFDEYNAAQANIVDIDQKGQSNFYNVIENSANFMIALSDLKIVEEEPGFSHRAFDNLAYALLKSNISSRGLSGLSMSAVLRLDAALKDQFSQIKHHTTNLDQIVRNNIEENKVETTLTPKEQEIESALINKEIKSDESKTHVNTVEHNFDGDELNDEIAEVAQKRIKKEKPDGKKDKKKKPDPKVPPVAQAYERYTKKKKEEEKIVLTFGDI